MPIMPPKPISRCQAITDIIESVAQEQAALGCVLGAECNKLNKLISISCLCPCDLLKANRSVERVINAVSRLEMILLSKLELFEDCLCSCPPHPMSVEAE